MRVSVLFSYAEGFANLHTAGHANLVERNTRQQDTSDGDAARRNDGYQPPPCFVDLLLLRRRGRHTHSVTPVPGTEHNQGPEMHVQKNPCPSVCSHTDYIQKRGGSITWDIFRALSIPCDARACTRHPEKPRSYKLGWGSAKRSMRRKSHLIGFRLGVGPHCRMEQRNQSLDLLFSSRRSEAATRSVTVSHPARVSCFCSFSPISCGNVPASFLPPSFKQVDPLLKRPSQSWMTVKQPCTGRFTPVICLSSPFFAHTDK